MSLSFFISDAMADAAGTAAQQGQQGLLSFLPLIVIFALFYFMLIRPQTKRAKEHKNMVAALQKGDEIVTNGGVLGRITDVGENFITLEIADNVQIKLQRNAIASLLPKGTYKSK